MHWQSESRSITIGNSPGHNGEGSGMRIIIVSDGVAHRRFASEIDGVPTPVIEVDGERVLERTVRQCNTYGAAQSKYGSGVPYGVKVVGPRGDARFDVEGASLCHAAPTPELEDLDVIYRTTPWWRIRPSTLPEADLPRIVLIFGHIWFTDDAIRTICTFDTHPWQFFGRKQTIPYGLSFRWDHIEAMQTAIAITYFDYTVGKTTQCTAWEMYKHLEGISAADHDVGPHWTEIDDSTDDIGSLATDLRLPVQNTEASDQDR